MKPNPKFINHTTPEFWANVKFISQRLGYTDRNTGFIKVYPLTKITDLYEKEGYSTNKIVFKNETTEFGKLLLEYFEYRAHGLT